jgi:hypothetical protein|tara:strand:- start:588 stop:782 length:195 start_codon:yes stop_codon:yes gene_type:complete
MTVQGHVLRKAERIRQVKKRTRLAFDRAEKPDYISEHIYDEVKEWASQFLSQKYFTIKRRRPNE